MLSNTYNGYVGLERTIPQMNNFVVYEGFFNTTQRQQQQIDDRRLNITARYVTFLKAFQYSAELHLFFSHSNNPSLIKLTFFSCCVASRTYPTSKINYFQNLTVLTQLYSVLILLVMKVQSAIFDQSHSVRQVCQLYKIPQSDDLELGDQHAVWIRLVKKCMLC